MSLDRCLTISPVTGPSCIPPTGNANCDTAPVPINICPPPINEVQGDPKCVNDNARRPWPTPPPAEIGCNPISLQVTNEPGEEDDPNQTIRLEGSVTYISGDACLPQVNLNLVVPPNIASGGGAPIISGFGYTQYANCVRIGPVQGSSYSTPQAFFSNEPGAAAFIAKSPGAMASGACEELCTARARFGSQVAKFNLIGPILAEITGHVPATYEPVDGQSIAVGWSYSWQPSVCVTAAGMCLPSCYPSSWTENPTSLQYADAWNNKEMVYEGYMTPGINLAKQLKKGFKPTPIMIGTQVLIYGWVPWGPSQIQNACDCPITYFFSEQVAFDGDCEESTDTDTAGINSVLPQRNITSAGMFFGSPENANRV